MTKYIDPEFVFNKFKELCNDKYFVDKSNIINEFNKNCTNFCNRYICITRPKGFGKSSIAYMLTSYYGKSFTNSKELFDGLNVSKDAQYEKYRGKYHTLYINFLENVEQLKTLREYLFFF